MSEAHLVMWAEVESAASHAGEGGDVPGSSVSVLGLFVGQIGLRNSFQILS